MPYDSGERIPGGYTMIDTTGVLPPRTVAETPYAANLFNSFAPRQEQSAPLAMGGGDGSSMARPAPPPSVGDAAPDMTGGGAGASGGGYSTKNQQMVVQGASTGEPAPVAQSVSYAERAAVPMTGGRKNPNELALNDAPGGGGGPPIVGDARAVNLEIGDYARKKQIEAEMRGGGPARMVKGSTFQTGMDTKTTVQGGKPVESILAMNDQQLTADLAGQSLTEAQRQYQAELQRNMEPYKAAEAEKDDYLATWKREELQKLTDDRAAAEKAAGETKIDPDHFWADKSTGQKIAFVLASALTGALNGRAGIQGNGVITAVNKRIDEDIAAQVRNLETKKGRVGELGRIYAQTLDKFGNMEVARNAAKTRGLLETEQLASAQAANSKNEVVKAQAEKVMADLATEREKLHFNNTGTVTSEVDKKFKTTQDKMVGGGGPNWKNIEAISARGVAAHPEAKPGGGPQVADFGGTQFDLGNMEPAEAAKARGKLAAINNFNADVATLRKMRESATERLFPSASQKAVQNRLAATMSNLQDMGVLQGNEREEYQNILSNFRGGDEALAGMQGFAMRTGNQIVTQAGGRPLAPPKGKLPMADPVPVGAPPPQTQTMYQKDGTQVEVPLGQVAGAVRSGALTFAKDQVVPVEGLDGQIVPMKGSEAIGFLKSRQSFGTNATSSGALMEQEERKAAGTVGGVVGATAAGAARGVTLGLSDAALVGLGGEGMRKELQKAQKYNPTASALGEGAGMLAPAFFTGGASGGASALGRAGRAATVVSRGATAAAETGGRLAERGIVGLGAAEGGNVAGAARVLATNAIEGGAQGIGQAISDASIKGEPLEVEKIIAHGGKAALLGAGLGGVLHGTVGLAKAGVSKAGGAIKEGVTNAAEAAREKLVNKIAGSLEGDAAAAGVKAEGAVADAAAGVEAKAAGAAPGMPGAPMAQLEDFKAKARDFLGAASKGDTEAMEKLGGDFLIRRSAEQMGLKMEGKSNVQLANEIADRLHVQSLTPTNAKAQKAIDKLTKDAQAAMPGMIEEDLRRLAGREKGAIMPREEMAEFAPALKREAGQDMEKVLTTFDKEAAGDAAKLPSMTPAKARMESEIIEPMLAEVRVVRGDKVLWKDGGERARIADAMRKQTEAFDGTTSFAQMHRDRRFFDEGVNFKATNPADVLKSKAFRQARNIMDDELTKAGDLASGTSGEAALKWQAAKNRYAAAKVIEENAIIGAAQDAKNRVGGLSEKLGAAQGAGLGATAGAALGSIVPVFGTAAGGFFGGLLGSAIGRHAANVERRVGGQYAARVARQVSDEGVLRGMMKEVDTAMDSKLGTYLGEKGVQGAAAAKNKLGDLLEKAGVETGQAAVKATETGAKVDKAAVRAADAAERTATRTEEKIASQVSKLEEEAKAAAPGQVRRALLEKVVAAKEAGAAKVAAIREKAAELGERAGRVRKALPGAPALAVEADRIQGRAAASRDEEYQKTRQRYADLAQSPGRIAEATASVRVARPDLAKGLDAKLMEIAKYVDGKAPLSTRGIGALTPNTVPDAVSPGQQAQFLEMVKAAQDPLSVLDDLAAGRATATQLRTIRDLYPALHADIVERVVNKLADRKEPLPYKQRLEIGLLIGAPTDASLEPAFIASTQATFQQPMQSGPAPRRADSAKPTGVAAATTKMQELGALDLDKRPYEGAQCRVFKGWSQTSWAVTTRISSWWHSPTAPSRPPATS